ncbi:MAG: phosphatidylinositol-specific phospholipase C domain-containing protein [Acutalibacteraceae bacterium]
MNINLSKWMEKINDGRSILSLDIPGAHDCAANFIHMARMSKCQNTDIYGLLSLGIRALDVRVALRDNKLILVHGVHRAFVSPDKDARALEIDDIIKQIKRFLNENPSETVIFQFKNDNEKHMEDCFDILYDRYIAKENKLWFTENRIPQIGEVRGKIVLFRRCEMYSVNKKYCADCAGIDLSRWVNQENLVPESLILSTHSRDKTEFIIQDRYNYSPKPRWRKCVEPFLSERKPFDGKGILCYLSTAGGLLGPEKNADYMNARFLSYPLQKENCYGILYFDFPTKDITKKVIENNL